MVVRSREESHEQFAFPEERGTSLSAFASK